MLFLYLVQMEENNSFKVEVISGYEAGKNLISFITGTDISSYYSTLGIGYAVYQLPIIGRKIIIQLWYQSDKERFRDNVAYRFKAFNSLIFTYTIDDMDSFKRIQDIVLFITSDDLLKNIQLILIGYNNDNDNRKREVSTKEAEDFANNNGLFFYEMKSSKDENIRDYINDAFLKIIPKEIPKNIKEKEKPNKKEKQEKEEKRKK